jgi:hypothetical protein
MEVQVMRRSFALLPFAVALAVTASLAHGADRGQAKVTLAGKSVAIDYGRPSLGGRDMLSQLQPGQSWRMGADAATTLKTEADLSFGGVAVPKGDYVLTAKLSNDGKWTLVAKQDANVVAEIPLASEKLSAPVETLTIELTGQGSAGRFAMKWGVSALSAPFTAK